MFGLDIKGNILEERWRGTLSDYVTAIAPTPDGQTWAASSAAGEVVLWRSPATLISLQAIAGQSVDCLGFSSDGKLLAAGGQNGEVKIWQVAAGEINKSPLYCLENAPAWIDRLAWNPASNLLAFGTGSTVQVWDAEKGEIAAKLNFAASSILDMAWHPTEPYLAISGDRGVKIWNAIDWAQEPDNLAIPSAALAIAWSPDGKYLAAGNMDKSIVVWQWRNPHPWVMRGFPGKIRALAWSEPTAPSGAPLLAVASAQSISVWEKQSDENAGWEAWILEAHEGLVEAIAFQPGTFLLASAAADGYVVLWQEAQQIGQIMEGISQGYSNLVWDTQGVRLAAAGKNGQWLIWSKSMRGQGFARRVR